MDMNESFVTIENLHFDYGRYPLLKGVSFSMQKKEIVALIGVSGSGKTTLFRLVSGLLDPVMGKVQIQGKLLNEGGKELITYMRQEDLLLPWRTVFSNLLLLKELGKEVKNENLRESAHFLLHRVGLSGCETLYPEELSGGMRQRVSLARALLQGRPLLLLDEPFGSLDVLIREELYRLVVDVKEEFYKTILFITHDFKEAVELSDRILILKEGRIVGDLKVSEEIKKDPHLKEALKDKIRAKLLQPIP